MRRLSRPRQRGPVTVDLISDSSDDSPLSGSRHVRLDPSHAVVIERGRGARRTPIITVTYDSDTARPSKDVDLRRDSSLESRVVSQPAKTVPCSPSRIPVTIDATDPHCVFPAGPSYKSPSAHKTTGADPRSSGHSPAQRPTTKPLPNPPPSELSSSTNSSSACLCSGCSGIYHVHGLPLRDFSPRQHDPEVQAQLERSAILRAGHRLQYDDDHYTIDHALGAGAFGHVYQARTKERQRVAIKVVSKAAAAYSCNESLDRLITEHRILVQATTEQRAFLTHLLASWSDKENVYFVMRAYPTNMYDWIRGIPSHKFTFTLYAAELVAALSNFHDMGYIHLDIKPSNVLIAPSGHLALADYGLATHATRDQPSGRAKGGTAGYVAPEVIAEELFEETGFTQRADVWSLGILLLQMYFQSRDPAHVDKHDEAALVETTAALRALTENPARMEKMRFLENHDPELHSLLSKMIVRNPSKRWSSRRLKTHSYFRRIDWTALERCPRLDICPVFPPSGTLSSSSSPSQSRPHSPPPQKILDELDIPDDYDFSFKCPDGIEARGRTLHHHPRDRHPARHRRHSRSTRS